MPTTPSPHERRPAAPTRQERRAAMAELVDLTEELGLYQAEEAEHAEFAAATAELVVRAELRVPACPVVVTGTVDGQAFSFRERHGRYRVEIPDGDPTTDLFASPDHPATVIAEGHAVLSPAAALRLSVEAVRAHRAR